MLSPKPAFYLNPRDPNLDALLARVVKEAGGQDPRYVERRLQRTYPAARVRPSQVEGDSTWYVYREGHWVR